MTRRHQVRNPASQAPGAGAGRDVTRLLSDFGHRLPAAQEPVVPAKEPGCSITHPGRGSGAATTAGHR